ncbi:MAG: KAP family NTPase [Fusobacterium mortiferum]|nr:KAP family NTPase [Fusobacterium mortiferum]
MKHYEKLTKKRKAFIEQLYNLINTQFEEQEKLIELESLKKVKRQKDKIKLIIEELENNSDYIQRIFIDAPWGMGKSFFSKALKEKIEKENETREEEIKLININAWETDYFSDPMKSLIGEIDEAIGLSNTIKEEAKNLFSRGVQTLKKIGWNEAFNFIGEIGLNKILNTVGINEEKRKEIVDTFNETKDINIDELKEYQKYKELVSNFKIALSKNKKLKVIVVDELDRCKPTYAIELLETVKHFFGVKNIIFVFLVNKEQLEGIASSSFITKDKCSEYFEKFFDIQFKLPELEYEDFIEIEYNKYNDIHTYNIKSYPPQNNIINNFFNNIKIDYIADDVNSFYEFLFLEAFKSNCDSSIVSPRNLIKSFKKFRLLLSSLSLKEKGCYPLMIVLVLYFIREEFLIKNNTEKNFKILDLYLKTFFKQNTLKKINNFNDIEDNFYEYFSIKRLFHTFQDFYKTFYFTLYYPTGKAEEEGKYYNMINYGIYISKLEKSLVKQVILTFQNINVLNKEIYYYNNISELNLFLDINFFQDLDVNNYIIKNTIISSNIIELWAKDKYEFTLLQ